MIKMNDNDMRGFERVVKGVIHNTINFLLMIGETDTDNPLLTDKGVYEEVLDGLYFECGLKIFETIVNSVESNFDTLKKTA